jgi:hypothetical protein
MTLDQLPYHRTAIVAEVDWAALTEPEQRRLRNLGLDEGVEVEALHGGRSGGSDRGADRADDAGDAPRHARVIRQPSARLAAE